MLIISWLTDSHHAPLLINGLGYCTQCLFTNTLYIGATHKQTHTLLIKKCMLLLKCNKGLLNY